MRFSVKSEVEGAYQILLTDPLLESDTLRAHRIIESLRDGESLAGFGGGIQHY